MVGLYTDIISLSLEDSNLLIIFHPFLIEYFEKTEDIKDTETIISPEVRKGCYITLDSKPRDISRSSIPVLLRVSDHPLKRVNTVIWKNIIKPHIEIAIILDIGTFL
jgi:hypothetical protein